ncbi:MAG: DoxX family protein [Chitinophagales bacterium]|nr:DoxX family protein [Chitinophagales bacterium]
MNNKGEIINDTFLLRLGVATIFLSHSLHGIFTGNDVNDFGNLFLNKIGFSPFGVFMAWGVVISQIITSLLLVANKVVKVSCIVNIIILIFGIITVHFAEGWYVVGAGRNGMEFSFILIIVLFAIIISDNRTAKHVAN